MFKRIFLPGFVAGIAMLAIGMGISAVFTALYPSLRTEYENTSIFRSMSDPFMMLYFFHPFFLGLALAWIWDKVKPLFGEVSDFRSMLSFALAYSLVSAAGMLISYSTFQISGVMVLSWTAGILFESVMAAFVFIKMNPS